MVPGSTFRYGSNFCSVTLSPRLSSRHPMLAAAIPLPKEETTPPVTNMYLAIVVSRTTRGDAALSPVLRSLRYIETRKQAGKKPGSPPPHNETGGPTIHVTINLSK